MVYVFNRHAKLLKYPLISDLFFAGVRCETEAMDKPEDREQKEEEEQFIPAEGPSSHQPEAEDLRISEFSLAAVIQQIQNIRHFINTASVTASEPTI